MQQEAPPAHNAVLYDNDSALQTFNKFAAELDSMFANPN